MSRNKSRQSKKLPNNDFAKMINGHGYGYSRDELINIHAEAYYKALEKIAKEKEKKIFEEKQECNKVKKKKWYIDLLFFMNIIFWPFKIHKRFKINERVYDNLLVVVVTAMLGMAGVICWLSGIVAIGYIVWNSIFIKPIESLSGLLLGVLGVFLGSFLIISGNEFSKESDSSKIYAYSASILALVSCVIGMIALVK